MEAPNPLPTGLSIPVSSLNFFSLEEPIDVAKKKFESTNGALGESSEADVDDQSVARISDASSPLQERSPEIKRGGKRAHYKYPEFSDTSTGYIQKGREDDILSIQDSGSSRTPISVSHNEESDENTLRYILRRESPYANKSSKRGGSEIDEKLMSSTSEDEAKIPEPRHIDGAFGKEDSPGVKYSAECHDSGHELLSRSNGSVYSRFNVCPLENLNMSLDVNSFECKSQGCSLDLRSKSPSYRGNDQMTEFGDIYDYSTSISSHRGSNNTNLPFFGDCCGGKDTLRSKKARRESSEAHYRMRKGRREGSHLYGVWKHRPKYEACDYYATPIFVDRGPLYYQFSGSIQKQRGRPERFSELRSLKYKEHIDKSLSSAQKGNSSSSPTRLRYKELIRKIHKQKLVSASLLAKIKHPRNGYIRSMLEKYKRRYSSMVTPRKSHLVAGASPNKPPHERIISVITPLSDYTASAENESYSSKCNCALKNTSSHVVQKATPYVHSDDYKYKLRSRIPPKFWTTEENYHLLLAVQKYGNQWGRVANMVKNRSSRQCKEHWTRVLSKRDEARGIDAPIIAKLSKDKEAETLLKQWKYYQKLFTGPKSDKDPCDTPNGVANADIQSSPNDDCVSSRSRRSYSDDESSGSLDAVRNEGSSYKSTHILSTHSKPCTSTPSCPGEKIAGKIKIGYWLPEEDRALVAAHARLGSRWIQVATIIPGRTKRQCERRFRRLREKLKKQAADMGLSSPAHLDE